MSQSTPLVEAGYLYDPAQPGARIPLDSPGWLARLEQPTARCFSYAPFDPTRGYIVGFLMVRTETRQRGGSYWIAYRRGQGRRRKVYLGRSSAVQHARLQVVARDLVCLQQGCTFTHCLRNPISAILRSSSSALTREAERRARAIILRYNAGKRPL
jgi:hypothetical protein